MKKIGILLMVIFISVTTGFAQDYDKSIGTSLNYGTYMKGLGWGFRYQQHFSEKFRIAPQITYFFNGSGRQGWEMSGDAHYLFNLENEKAKLYPILGVTLLIVNFKEGTRSDLSKNKVGINLGAGGQYDLSSRFALFGEVKYAVVSSPGQAAIAAGVAYKF
jgi:hypothetical protein